MVETSLGEITFISTGKLDVNAQDINGIYPFFTCGEENLSINTAAFDTEAVLLAGNGNFSVKYYKGKFNAYQRTYVIEPNLVDGKWLYYLVMHHIAKITAGARGSTIKYLRVGDITACPVNLVPLAQQKRIVSKIEELFSELDNGIAALETAREQLKIYRQTVLKHAFEGKLTTVWRKKNTDKLETPDQILNRILEERKTRHDQQLKTWKVAVKEWENNGKLGRRPNKPRKLVEFDSLNNKDFKKNNALPLGWSYVKLGFLIDEPRYGTSAKCEYDSGEQSVLRIPNICDDSIDDSDLKFATFEKGEIDDLRLLSGDILTIRSNGSISLVGTCALVQDKDTKHIFAGYLIRIRPNQNLVVPEFLLQVLGSHSLRVQIELAAKSTSGVNNINSKELQSLVVPLPSIEEQKELVTYFDTILPSIKTTKMEIENQLVRAEILRQSILKKAFSNQLIPQEPDDEPARDLLTRIKAEKGNKA